LKCEAVVPPSVVPPRAAQDATLRLVARSPQLLESIKYDRKEEVGLKIRNSS
jgi:hypothetical protein